MSLRNPLRLVRAAKLARRKPRIYGPALVAIPLVMAPLLVGFFAGRKAAAAGAVIGLLLVAAYALIALQPLVRFIPALPPNLSRSQTLLRELFRQPLGTMLYVGTGVALWIAVWSLILRDERILESPWVLAWTVGIFATLGGVSWWEIFYGKEARKARDRFSEDRGHRAAPSNEEL